MLSLEEKVRDYFYTKNNVETHVFNISTINNQIVNLVIKNKNKQNFLIEIIRTDKILKLDKLIKEIKKRVIDNENLYIFFEEIHFVFTNSLTNWNEGLQTEKITFASKSFDRIKMTIKNSEIYSFLKSKGIGILLFHEKFNAFEQLLYPQSKKAPNCSELLYNLQNSDIVIRRDAIQKLRNEPSEEIIPFLLKQINIEINNQNLIKVFQTLSHYKSKLRDYNQEILSKYNLITQKKSRLYFLDGLLNEIGGKAIENFLACILENTENDIDSRKSTIYSLIKIQSKNSLHKVVNQTEVELEKDDIDIDLLKTLIYGLSKLDESNYYKKEKITLAIKLVELELDKIITENSMILLGKLKSKEAIQLLIEKNHDFPSRDNYIIEENSSFPLLLHEILIEIGLDEVIKSLSDKKTIVRKNAAKILGEIKIGNYSYNRNKFDELIVHSFLKVLDDGEQEVRFEAAKSLGYFGQQALDGKQKLNYLYRNDPVERVKDIAGGALNQIGQACGFSDLDNFVERSQIISQTSTNNELFISDEYFDDAIYPKVIEELNFCFGHHQYISVFFLSRKIIENCIIDILSKNYSNESNLWCVQNSSNIIRIINLSTLIENLCNKSELFSRANLSSFVNNIDLIKDKLDKIREKTNIVVHSIAILPQESDANELRDLMNWIIPILYRIK